MLLLCRSSIGKRFPDGILPNAQTSTVEGTLAITWKWFLDILGKTNLWIFVLGIKMFWQLLWNRLISGLHHILIFLDGTPRTGARRKSLPISILNQMHSWIGPFFASKDCELSSPGAHGLVESAVPFNSSNKWEFRVLLRLILLCNQLLSFWPNGILMFLKANLVIFIFSMDCESPISYLYHRTHVWLQMADLCFYVPLTSTLC